MPEMAGKGDDAGDKRGLKTGRVLSDSLRYVFLLFATYILYQHLFTDRLRPLSQEIS